jgi:hypothetical protein
VAHTKLTSKSLDKGAVDITGNVEDPVLAGGGIEAVETAAPEMQWRKGQEMAANPRPIDLDQRQRL